MASPQTLVQADSMQESFEALLSEHRRIVLKVAATYCANREDRRDLAQEISVQLWRAFPSYDSSRPFSTWMYRVALNVAISFVRQSGRHHRHTTTLDEDAIENVAADETPEPDERVRLLHEFIGQLDDLNRALVLLYLDERSYSDMADVLGISETNVATKLNRLKQRIEDNMELDELKAAWRELERRLDENNALTGQLLREKRLDKTRSTLRRIAWGQSLQIVIWIGIVSIVAPFWIEHRGTPHFLAAGLVMHLYGVVTIILSARQLVLIASVNYGKPVVELQAQIACLRRVRVRDQLWLGLPWWILWVVATMIGAQRWLGLDIYAPAPAWIWINIAIGIVGIVLTLWLPRVFANTPRGSRFLQNTLDNLAGRSLVRAARQLDEIAQFSRE